MGFEESLAHYLTWLGVRNYAPATIVGRRYYVGHFAQWCTELGLQGPQDVSAAVLESYQRYVHRLPGKGLRLRLTAHTQSQYLISIMQYFRYLVRSGRLAADPSAALELPREEQRLPRLILSIAEITKLLELPDITTLYGLRDRAILETFYSTAMRASDLQNMTLQDLNLADRVALLKQGKTKRDRYVPLGERCAYWLEKYLHEVRPLLVRDGSVEAVFVDKGVRFGTSKNLSHLVAEYLELAGLRRGSGACHLLRHACATHMLHNGADLRSIQELLGHLHLATTQIYTRVALVDLRKVHAKTHPLHGLSHT